MPCGIFICQMYETEKKRVKSNLRKDIETWWLSPSCDFFLVQSLTKLLNLKKTILPKEGAEHQSIYHIRRVLHGSIWWLPRITLVVAFGFLPQNFERWQGPTNDTLSFYECRLSGGDTQILPLVTKFLWICRDTKTSTCAHSCPCAQRW